MKLSSATLIGLWSLLTLVLAITASVQWSHLEKLERQVLELRVSVARLEGMEKVFGQLGRR